jgi:hypothetical protein
MLVAVFRQTTGWSGLCINHEDGQFIVEGQGQISADAVLAYDSQGHLTWATDQMRAWVQTQAAPEPPPPSVAPPIVTPLPTSVSSGEAAVPPPIVTESTKPMKFSDVSREGRRLLTAELLRRGASLVVPQRSRKALLRATSADGSATANLRVKVKRRGSWQTSIDEGRPMDGEPTPEDARRFWVLLDIGGPTRYWIMPEWWIRNYLFEGHQQYLKEHGGHRPVNDLSRHSSIDEAGVAEWQDKWEVLGLF